MGRFWVLQPIVFVLFGTMEYPLASCFVQLNPLHAKCCRGSIHMYFHFYVIPPHWYDTGSWNPSSWKPRTCLFSVVNIMGVDVIGDARSQDISGPVSDIGKPGWFGPRTWRVTNILISNIWSQRQYWGVLKLSKCMLTIRFYISFLQIFPPCIYSVIL